MLNSDTIYLLNGCVVLLTIFGLQYWLNKNRYKKRARTRNLFADTTVVVGGPTAPPMNSIYTCPICLQTLTAACEALPCGHEFCGKFHRIRSTSFTPSISIRNTNEIPLWHLVVEGYIKTNVVPELQCWIFLKKEMPKLTIDCSLVRCKSLA